MTSHKGTFDHAKTLSDYPAVLLTADLAEYLRIPEERARKMCRDGEIRAFQVGKSWRIDRDAVVELQTGATQ